MNKLSSFVTVPRIILNDKSCSSTSKLLLGLICSLSNSLGYCYANNNFFAKSLGLSNRTITKSLKELRDMAYIDYYYDNRKRLIYITRKTRNENNC